MINWFRGILILGLIFSFISCQEENDSVPSDLIQKGEMVMILKDITKIEARFQRRLSLHGKHNNDLVFENYKVVFDEHQVSIDQFKSSYSYYQDSPADMQMLYDSVIVELTKEQSVLESEMAKEAKNKDKK